MNSNVGPHSLILHSFIQKGRFPRLAHGVGLQNLSSRVRIPSRPHGEFSLTGKTLRYGRREQGSSPGFTQLVSIAQGQSVCLPNR